MTTTTPTAEVVQTTGRSTVRIGGYISSDAAEPMEAAFAQVADAQKVLVVFAEDAFINSTGIAILFDLALPLKDQGRDVRIVHPSQHFRKVFDIVGLSRDVGIFESEEDAEA